MADVKTSSGTTMGRSGPFEEASNSGAYTKDTTVRGFYEEPTPVGRTITSGLERNPTSLPIGTPTPARNSGAGSGPSAAMAMHNATRPAVL
jgi:hypothetical protein